MDKPEFFFFLSTLLVAWPGVMAYGVKADDAILALTKPSLAAAAPLG